MQAWGLPRASTAAALQPATYYSGYIKRAPLLKGGTPALQLRNS